MSAIPVNVAPTPIFPGKMSFRTVCRHYASPMLSGKQCDLPHTNLQKGNNSFKSFLFMIFNVVRCFS